MPRSFVALLLAGGLLLSATVLPGIFTVDEDNYLTSVLALRQGRLTLPGTEGLPPTNALLYFDPTAIHRTVERTPVSSNAPPLYGIVALPFSYLGWRGLVAINTLAFLGTTALAFAYARRYAGSARAGWLAAAAFALGGFALEYAQGMWPHMLAAGLCTASFVLAARVRDGAHLGLALAAGLIVGLAAGVRYQNVVVAGAIGLGLVLFAPRRVRAGAAFAAGLALPLLASSFMNHARMGSWNPISKGKGYLAMGGGSLYEGGNAAREFVHVLAAKVVDFTLNPPLPEVMQPYHQYMQKDPQTGAVVIGDTLKKAWLQSSPWLSVALAFLVFAWLAYARRPRERPTALERELAAASLVVFGMLAVFAVAGFSRTDGLCFNQRYFLELTPLAAVSLAWALEGQRLSLPALLAAAGVALLAAIGVTSLFDGEPAEALLLMHVPPLLAGALLVVWLAGRRGVAVAGALSLAVGASFGWALGVHGGEDLRTSRDYRRISGAYRQALATGISERAAVFAVRGDDDFYGPLQLERDLVILDPRMDLGRSAPALVSTLLAQGRRVFVASNDFPLPLFQRMAGDRPVRAVPPIPVLDGHAPLLLVEIGAAADAAPATAGEEGS